MKTKNIIPVNDLCSGKKKLLLLNPPGHKLFFRDYYCSKVSKGGYYYHPVDLVYLSGRLSAYYEVFVIDAIAEKINTDQCLEKIINYHPQVVVFLCSAPSYYEDLRFIFTLKKNIPETTFIGTGDVFRDYGEKALKENDCIDALLLDFSTDDIVRFLAGTENKISNVIYRRGNDIVSGGEHHSSGSFDLPLPRWDLFNLKAYRFPFARNYPFASILTDFGCPFSCDFCPISTLGYKLRSIPAVMEELRLLKQMGVRELYVRDQTFGVNYKRTVGLLQAMINEKFDFSWTCLSRTDILNGNLLELMGRAGCHTIMLGIESANEQLLETHKKNIKHVQNSQAISAIKKAGIRAGGFFMIGFPSESRQSILATAKLSRHLSLDYVSFNIAAPRLGTPFRTSALESGIINADITDVESTEGNPVWVNQEVSGADLLKLKKQAIRRFYLRPHYLFKRIVGIKSVVELQNLIREAISLLIKTI